MKNKLIVGVIALFALGLVGNAVADGIPTVTPLTYSGVLQNAAGAPLTTAQSIQLTLWDDATANASADQKCVTPTQNMQPDAQGRFQIVLDQACFDAVKGNPNLWVQLQIGSTVLPRTKIGAVPFSVESARASRTILSVAQSRASASGLACGSTPSLTGAVNYMAATGYAAVKLLCEQSCNSETAHICTTSEAISSYSLGKPAYGRIAGGLAPQGLIGGLYLNDCGGFTLETTDSASLFWYIGAASPGVRGCDATDIIACCD